MKWPFVLRSTYDRRVNGLQLEIAELYDKIDVLTKTNITDIAEFIVADFPALQEELRNHRGEFIKKTI